MSRYYQNGRPKELQEYPVMLQARDIMELLGVCEAVAYQVMHHQDCPTVYFGKRMAVPRDGFWNFLLSYQGKRLW